MLAGRKTPVLCTSTGCNIHNDWPCNCYDTIHNVIVQFMLIMYGIDWIFLVIETSLGNRNGFIICSLDSELDIFMVYLGSPKIISESWVIEVFVICCILLGHKLLFSFTAIIFSVVAIHLCFSRNIWWLNFFFLTLVIKTHQLGIGYAFITCWVESSFRFFIGWSWIASAYGVSQVRNYVNNGLD